MTHLAMIDLDVPGSNRAGRVFLDRDQLARWPVHQLEQELAHLYFDSEDAERMKIIEALLHQGEELEVAVFPGEESPPVYHAYIKDPNDPGTRLFACVLAPEAVVQELVQHAPHPVFETATFQVILGEATPTAMFSALSQWVRRVWPDSAVPAFKVLPWPIEEVHTALPPAPQTDAVGTPKGALTLLPNKDFPTLEELTG